MTESSSLSSIPIDVIRDHLTFFLSAESCLRFSLTNQSYFHLYQQSDFANKTWEIFFQRKWRILYSSDEEEMSSFINENENLWLARYNRQLKQDADTISTLELFLEFENPLRLLKMPHFKNAWFRLVQKGAFATDAVHSVWVAEKSNENKIFLESLVQATCQFSVISKIKVSTEEMNTWPIEKLPTYLAKIVDWNLYLQNCDSSISIDYYVDKELNTFAEIIQTHLQHKHPSCMDGCYPILSIIEAMKTIFIRPSEANQNALASNFSNEFSFSVKEQGSLSPFVGNTINYYAVSNSMIHKVLFFRTGIPITLSVIYAAIVRRATGVQLDPLGIPGHFLLSTVISDEQSNTEQRIFIDVFDGGSIMTINNVQRLLLSFGVSWSDSFLKPASNIEICSRMIRNVLNCPDFSSSDTSCIYSFLKFLSKKEVEE